MLITKQATSSVCINLPIIWKIGLRNHFRNFSIRLLQLLLLFKKHRIVSLFYGKFMKDDKMDFFISIMSKSIPKEGLLPINIHSILFSDKNERFILYCSGEVDLVKILPPAAFYITIIIIVMIFILVFTLCMSETTYFPEAIFSHIFYWSKNRVFSQQLWILQPNVIILIQ